MQRKLSLFVVVMALAVIASLLPGSDARADDGYFYAAPSYYVAPPLYYQPYVVAPVPAPVYYAAPPVAYYAAPPAGYFYQPAYAVPYGYPLVTPYFAPYRKVELDWNHWHGGWEVDID